MFRKEGAQVARTLKLKGIPNRRERQKQKGRLAMKRKGKKQIRRARGRERDG